MPSGLFPHADDFYCITGKGDVRSTAAGGGKAPRSGVVAGGDRREPPVSYNDIRRPRRGQRTQDKYIVKKRYQTHVHHILAILFHNYHSIFRMTQT